MKYIMLQIQQQKTFIYVNNQMDKMSGRQNFLNLEYFKNMFQQV